MDIVTIKYYDEAYIKVKCDPSISMEISSFFTFDVPGAKFSPAFKNKVWDGKIRLFNPMNALLYAGLIEQLESFCKSRNYELQYEGIQNDYEFSLIEAQEFINKLNPKHAPRDYQIEAFIHGIRKRRSLLLSPTGSGKSLIIYMIACWYATKTLIIVPTTSLVHQMSADFEDYGYPKNSIHKIMSGKEKHSDKMIYCSTWQSIYKMPKEWFDQFKLVIGDEAHGFKSKSLIKIMTNLNKCPNRYGFTGTLDGTQTHRLVLEGLFGSVKKVTTTSELINQKHLSDFNIKVLILKHPDIIKQICIKNSYQEEMDFLVNSTSRNRFIKNLALSLEGNTLLLFQYVEKHGKVLFDMIQKESVNKPIYYIAGDVEGSEREKIRNLISNQKNSITVASFGTMSTGINIPNLHNIIFASPTKAKIKTLQSIGRVLRLAIDKDIATLYDIADDLSWKSKKNYTLLHLVERIKIYNEAIFDYKIYNIDLK